MRSNKDHVAGFVSVQVLEGLPDFLLGGHTQDAIDGDRHHVSNPGSISAAISFAGCGFVGYNSMLLV